MKKTFTFFCFQFLFFTLFSQNETKKWFFGFYESIDFITNPPTPSSTLSQMGSMSACASIADAGGNLLFYTNGANIWNPNHAAMANSNSLIPNGVSAQSTIILKKPGVSNQYFVFCQSASNSTSHGLFYAIVDMNLASGQGSVVIKNQLLDTTRSNGKMAATAHCNGNDIWLLKHDLNNNHFKAHLLTVSGISTTPIITAIGQIGFMANGSQMKFSPNGKKIAYPASTNLEVYDFDKSNGVLSNSLTLNSNMMNYTGCEFSPNGSVIYACANHILSGNTPDEICQWHLCAGNAAQILASKKVIDTLQGAYHRSIQLAPNGKIYISSGSNNLSVINNPNALGAACNYSNTAFNFNWPSTIMSLPAFNSSYFYLYPSSPTYSMLTQVLCQTVSFSCAILNSIPGCVASGNSPNTALWDFGEANAGPLNHSTALNPKHIYANSGTYTAQAIITHDCKTDTIYKVINITAYNPTITIAGRDTICQKELLTLIASGANSFTWSTGAITNSIAAMPQFQFTYAVVGTNTVNNCWAEKTFTANVNICEGLEELQLQSKLLLFPNPANARINFKLESPAIQNKQNLNVILFDAYGNLMDEKRIQANTTEAFELANYPEGLYIISLFHDNQRISAKKITIARNQ